MARSQGGRMSVARRFEGLKAESDSGVTAIDQEIAAGDKARRVAREKHGGLRKLVRLAEPLGQMLGAESLIRRLKRVIAQQRPPCLDRARRQRVAAHILIGVID